MAIVNRWRLRCVTEDADVYVLLDEDDAAPTSCPNNTAHTVDAPTAVIIEVIGQELRTSQHGEVIVEAIKQVDGGLRKPGYNFCDACTWWQESAEVLDGATTSTDQLTYTLSSGDKVLDLRHGRMPYEDAITAATVAPNGNTLTNLVPTVGLNGVPLAQSNEDATSGVDRYTVDYRLGKVVFAIARDPADVVTLSCRKPTTSQFRFKPTAGKKWRVEDAEIDVTENVDMKVAFVTEIWGSHSAAPPAGTGGTLAKLAENRYKTFAGFQAAARRFYGPLPSGMGATLGLPAKSWTFEWDYARADEFYATLNYKDLNVPGDGFTLNEIRMSLVGDVEYGGGFLFVTFFGQEVDEAS